METESITNNQNNLKPYGIWLLYGFWLLTLILLCIIFNETIRSLISAYNRKDSYYSHGFLVPFVSLYFVWQDRGHLREMPRKPSYLGILFLSLSCLMVLLSALVGFRIFSQAALIPLLIGMILLSLGLKHVLRLWFPLLFLLFMIPIPESITTSMTFHVKMLATEGAVRLSNLFFLPMIRDGSYIHFGEDRLLVGDVCSGLRSLIALLALGTIMSYISHTRPWSRIIILLVSGPIAVIANALRIFFLCFAAYFWGSAFASGKLHDISGVFIYIFALAFLLGLEGILRKIAPKKIINTGEDI